MAENDIPGVSVGIVADGEIAYTKGFGVAEYGTDRAMTPQNQFAVAEATFAPTAIAVDVLGMLIDQ